MRSNQADSSGSTIIGGALVTSVIVAFLSIINLFVVPPATPVADMYVEPRMKSIAIGDVFTVNIVVDAKKPVNVFKGEVAFDSKILAVERIDYNTSIANLWAEKPWYENGEGTLNFIGGTTQSGGFVGIGSLVTITFRAHGEGPAVVRIHDARILAYDGLGTDVPMGEPDEALFTVEAMVEDSEVIAVPESTTVSIAVGDVLTQTDLNGDGKQTIADVSIFMLGMLGNNPRFDFNRDGAVNGIDLSIILERK